MKIIKKQIWNFLNKIKLGGPVQLMINGALIEDGWYRSFHTKKSVDKTGNPIPWCTYSFIKFIEPRLKKDFEVFEYGCGNSTIWYAKRVNSIKSVEHDDGWLNTIKAKLPTNAEVEYCELSENGKYSKSILKEQKFFHLIIIDGRDRNNCVKQSINKLRSDGVIIFDNAQLQDYKSSINYLFSVGFREIPFVGLLPIVTYNNTTSIFYKENNCLGI